MSAKTNGKGISPVVAWDVFEHRIYGAPGETQHKVLWVENYRRSDGTTPDLDWLLEECLKGGSERAAKTIHVRPLVYADEPQPIDKSTP